MLTRRDAVAATVFAGIGAATARADAAPPPETSASAVQDDAALKGVLQEIRDELRAWKREALSCRMPMCGGLSAIRSNQRQFLKSNQKYPDYMEVGINVWDEIIDWHVRTLRQVETSQRPDGRYTIPFLHTTIVLRIDYGDDQVGLGYDLRAGA